MTPTEALACCGCCWLLPHLLYPLLTFISTGAGSETTVAAVITDSDAHRKATTGMDALAHAVEAYTNKTHSTKVENRLVKEAVKLIHQRLIFIYT